MPCAASIASKVVSHSASGTQARGNKRRMSKRERIVQGGGVVVQRGLGRTDSVSFSQARRLEPIVLPRCENNIQWDNPYYCVMKPSKCTSITMLLANETALQYRGPSKPAVQHRLSDVGPVCEQRIASSVMLCGVSYKGGGPAS